MSQPASGNDILTMLEAEHRRFEELLRQGELTTEAAVGARARLLDRITDELNLHENIEERVLYPALRAYPEAIDVVLGGYQEHHSVDLLVQDLHEVAANNERWGNRFKAFKENIEHHIQDEEGKLFRTARAVMSRNELEQLGVRMREIKAGAGSGSAPRSD